MRSHFIAKEYWSDSTENYISVFLCYLPDQEVLYTVFLLHIARFVGCAGTLVEEVLAGGYVITHEGFENPSIRVAMAAFLRRVTIRSSIHKAFKVGICRANLASISVVPQTNESSPLKTS